jgi:hypothetical protein
VCGLRNMDLKIEKRTFVLKHPKKTAKMRTEGGKGVCVGGSKTPEVRRTELMSGP